MLDYAANGLSYWTLDRLRQDAAETAQQQGSELDLLIQELVDQEDEDVVEQYWSAVERNLKDGRVRLVFVVDKAPRELRRLAEFLNERLADIDVLIVEISQYRSEDHVVLVPRLLGMTEASRLQKQASGTLRKPPLNQEMFLAQLSPVQKQLTEKIWQVAHENGYVIGWRPTAYAVRARQQTSGKERTFLYGYPAGHISIYLETIPLSPQAGAELRSRLLATQLFHESGKHTLPSVAIDATNQAELIKMVKVVCDYVDAALKPL